ncbi:hypothetical protein ZWY2020_007135 [Hordeum vulgare]|nr:hypothetical protein ZWY2020_007135 [Hordeum vulgare]
MRKFSAAATTPGAPPISRIPVGAVVWLGESGRIYAGVNLDFLGAPLSQAVHAEQFLIADAAAAVEPALRIIAVSHMPCGHCRQFLQEISTHLACSCVPEIHREVRLRS